MCYFASGGFYYVLLCVLHLWLGIIFSLFMSESIMFCFILYSFCYTLNFVYGFLEWQFFYIHALFTYAFGYLYDAIHRLHVPGFSLVVPFHCLGFLGVSFVFLLCFDCLRLPLVPSFPPFFSPLLLPFLMLHCSFLCARFACVLPVTSFLLNGRLALSSLIGSILA